jgi:hypothetical protein
MCLRICGGEAGIGRVTGNPPVNKTLRNLIAISNGTIILTFEPSAIVRPTHRAPALEEPGDVRPTLPKSVPAPNR